MQRAPAQPIIASANGQDAAKARVREGSGNLPLYLVENRGQVDERAAFYAQGSDTTIYFTGRGLTFALNGERRPRENQKSSRMQQGALKGDLPRAAPYAGPETWQWYAASAGRAVDGAALMVT